jgi:hypothetical protein
MKNFFVNVFSSTLQSEDLVPELIAQAVSYRVQRHHDTQHNNIQHNDTQHKGLIYDIQLA